MKFPLAILALATAAQSQNLPDGPGKAVVEKVCSDCHGVATIAALRKTRDAWDATVDEMTSRGAKGTDEEFDTIVNYLARYLGKVNVNKATPKEIEEIADLTPAEAEAIAIYRSKNGDFKNFEELHKVKEIDPNKLDERKDRFAFQ